MSSLMYYFTKVLSYRHTPNLFAITVCTVASTVPIFIFPLSSVAAWVQCGTRFLQCPHHGAKNSTSQKSSLSRTNSSKLLSVNSITASGSDFCKNGEKNHSFFFHFRISILNLFVLDNTMKHVKIKFWINPILISVFVYLLARKPNLEKKIPFIQQILS